MTKSTNDARDRDKENIVVAESPTKDAVVHYSPNNHHQPTDATTNDHKETMEEAKDPHRSPQQGEIQPHKEALEGHRNRQTQTEATGIQTYKSSY